MSPAARGRPEDFLAGGRGHAFRGDVRGRRTPWSGISLAQAVDTLWFCFGQNAWCSLIGEREWTFERAEEWLREGASRDLL